MANSFGGSGNDQLNGTSGNDYIVGGAGADTISGGNGNDRLEGFGPIIDNSSFDLDANLISAGNPVPFWETSGGGDAQVVVTDNNGQLEMSNGGIAGPAGNSSISQDTGIIYNSAEDYGFSAAVKVVGSNIPSSQIQLQIYVKDAAGNLTLIADSGPEFVANTPDGAGYLLNYEVNTQDDGVNIPAGLEGEIVVQVNQVSGVAGSEKLVITDTSFSSTDPNLYVDGDDIISGDAGDDLIIGDLGNDVLSGGDDNDEIFGNEGDDTVTGDAGDDTIVGNAGDDTIEGGDGNDIIFGDGFAVSPPENGGTFFGGPEANDWTFSGGREGDFSVDETNGAIFLDTNGFNGSAGGIAQVTNPLGENYDPNESYTVNFNYWAQANETYTDRIVVRIFLRGEDADGNPVGTRLENIIRGRWDAEGGAIQDYSFEFGPRPDLLENYTNAEMRIQIQAWGDVGDGTDPNVNQGVWINNVQVSSTDPLWGIQSSVDLTAPPVDGVTNNDVIMGGAGDDEIYGMEGDDTIDAGDGDDTVEGGAGNDAITVGLGDTVVSDDVYQAGTNTITEAGVAGYDKDSFVIDGAMTSSSGSTTITVDGGTGTTTGDEADDFDTIDWSSLIELHGKPVIEKTLDADGNSYSGTATFTTSDGQTIVIDFTEIEQVPCFTRGTLIHGADGPVAVEDIKAGDFIMTKDHGVKPVIWASSRQLSFADAQAHGKLMPVRISAGALGQGLPQRDLIVSPQHRILVRSNAAQRIVGAIEVLVAAKELVALEGIDFVTQFDEVEYFHFMFDQHEIVLAEGAASESLYAGPEILPKLPHEVREEVLALFPEIEGMDINDILAEPARDIAQGTLARRLVNAHARHERPLIS